MKVLKRGFDIIISLLALLLLMPFLLFLAIVVGMKLGHPILFAQYRPGRYGKVFRMYKFRTMTNACDASGAPLPDHERLTDFGKWLRKTSLDELPELWNVLKGDMSLVGPRPLLVEYLPLYNERQSKRHDMRPGVTGWAQVNGRNAITWEKKFELDVWYVENWSLELDLRILIMTLERVIGCNDITAAEHETMYPFSGTHSEKAKEFKRDN